MVKGIREWEADPEFRPVQKVSTFAFQHAFNTLLNQIFGAFEQVVQHC